MDREIVARLHSSFEAMVQKLPGGEAEFWCARDLQLLLGYAQWKNFAKVVDKAITACSNAGYDPKDHFADISKMVALGSGFNIKENDMRTEMRITGEHVENNQEVRICSSGVDAQGRGGYSSESNTTAKKEYTGHGRSRAICR